MSVWALMVVVGVALIQVGVFLQRRLNRQLQRELDTVARQARGGDVAEVAHAMIRMHRAYAEFYGSHSRYAMVATYVGGAVLAASGGWMLAGR